MKAIKSYCTHHIQTHNPSSANAGEALYVRIPKLDKPKVFVPNSLMLKFDFNITGHEDNHVVNNLGSNISSRDVIKLGGEIIYDLSHCYFYYTYKDLWLTRKQRGNDIFQGIHKNKKLSKLRSGHAKESNPVGVTEKDKEDKLQNQQLMQ